MARLTVEQIVEILNEVPIPRPHEFGNTLEDHDVLEWVGSAHTIRDLDISRFREISTIIMAVSYKEPVFPALVAASAKYLLVEKADSWVEALNFIAQKVMRGEFSCLPEFLTAAVAESCPYILAATESWGELHEMVDEMCQLLQDLRA